jgi:hypothetical protein
LWLLIGGYFEKLLLLCEKLMPPLVRLAPLRALDLYPILARAGDIRPVYTLRHDTFHATLAARLEECVRVEEHLRALDVRCVDAGHEPIELLAAR